LWDKVTTVPASRPYLSINKIGPGRVDTHQPTNVDNMVRYLWRKANRQIFVQRYVTMCCMCYMTHVWATL